MESELEQVDDQSSRRALHRAVVTAFQQRPSPRAAHEPSPPVLPELVT